MPWSRVYFVGSGPSIAMGVPSVNEIYSEIITEKSRYHETFSLENTVKSIFPNMNENSINFEELLTVLDVDAIGPEIFKVQRAGGDEVSNTKMSIGNAYEILMENVAKLLYDAMGNAVDWEWFAKNHYHNDPNSREVLLNSRRALEPIRSFWANQYGKIKPLSVAEGCVITTNYDVLIEKQLEKKYCYTNSNVDKTLIIKLHGSMNWEELSAEQFPEKESIEEYEILSFRKETRIVARPVSYIGKHAGSVRSLKPVLVPPMTQKRYEEPLFRQMFWQASNVLLKAKELVVLGYRFSEYDFFVKRLIDYVINSESGSIKNIYHYDLDENVGLKLKSMIRKSGIDYKFIKIDFTKEVPDFEHIGEVLSF